MTTASIGVLHPGAMGSSVIKALAANGHEVLWCDDGRSAATRARAEAAGAKSCATLQELADRCELLLSVCPPEFADKMAAAVLATGFTGLYIDGNAIAPARAEAISTRFAGRYVDGGIIGPPATTAGSTRLYLSGERAPEVATLFAGTALEAIVMAESGCAASALKMCYAAWTKGSSGLLLSVCALADSLQVGPALADEWDRSQPGVGARAQSMAGALAPKAWRFAAEMREIAATYAAADLPVGWHTGAAEFYDLLAGFKGQRGVSLAEVLAELESRPDRKK